MNRRASGFLILMVIGLVFLSTAFAVLGRFALPSAEWVSAGPAADFPPAEAPYPFRETGTGLIYIVNTGGEILALSAVSPQRGTVINWVGAKNRFINPGPATIYYRDGTYENGPDLMDMLRYPVKLEDGILWIDLAGIGR